MDYSKGKIYKIFSDKTDKIYIGSTTKDLKQRLKKHKDNYINFKKGTYASNVRVYEILKLGGNIQIELIENIVCCNKIELRQKEQASLSDEKYKPYLINNNRAIAKEPNEMKLYAKNYYNTRKQELSLIIKCECGGKYNYYSKSRHLKGKKHMSFLVES